MKQSALVLFGSILALALAQPAQARGIAALPPPPPTSIIVNSLADPGDGTCDQNECTLREAIAIANGSSGESIISFKNNGVIVLGNYLSLTNPARVTIRGPITLSGDLQFTILLVNSPSYVTLQRITFTQGHNETDGGAMVIALGAVTLEDCTFYDNHATLGGAIYGAGGYLTIWRSTFTGNGRDTSGAHGGALLTSGIQTSIFNSTFENNTAENGAAIYNTGGQAVNISSSTFSGNHVTIAGSASIYNNSGSVYFHNTIIANTVGAPVGFNCAGFTANIINEGNNIESGSTCGFGSDLGSMSNTNPLLAPLGNNGGWTQTMRLLPGSPAIDGATYTLYEFPATDQRGFIRPFDGNMDGSALYDIGAYEFGWRIFLPLILR